MLTWSCEKLIPDKFYGIIIRNNSNRPITYIIDYNYPDTLLPSENNWTTYLEPGEEWVHDNDYNLFNGILESDTLIIFILSVDTVNAYNWSQIVSDYKILKRYDLSEQDMDAKKEDGYIPVINYP